jgi:hypothetical protein
MAKLNQYFLYIPVWFLNLSVFIAKKIKFLLASDVCVTRKKCFFVNGSEHSERREKRGGGCDCEQCNDDNE